MVLNDGKDTEKRKPLKNKRVKKRKKEAWVRGEKLGN